MDLKEAFLKKPQTTSITNNFFLIFVNLTMRRFVQTQGKLVITVLTTNWTNEVIRMARNVSEEFRSESELDEANSTISSYFRASIVNHLKEYSDQNYENGKKFFVCSPCGNTYHSRQNLEDHQNAVHLKKMGFVCEICDLAFGWKRSLDRHNNSKHREGGKKIKKSKVGELKLEGDDAIKKELQEDGNEESTSKRKHMCSLCGNTYHSK